MSSATKTGVDARDASVVADAGIDKSQIGALELEELDVLWHQR